MDKRLKKIPLSETERAVLAVVRSRHKLGRSRYKASISFKQSSDPIHWVQQAIEEAADQLQYLVALKLLLESKRASTIKICMVMARKAFFGGLKGRRG